MAKTTSSSSSKPKGLSLHIGLNAVSPAAYGGWSGDLAACEFDAKDMAAIATSRGMKPTMLLTKQGTRAKTLAAMRKAAKQLRKGDFFFLTYSGHGGQVPDITGEETDKQDETWCLFDGQLIDDELYFELSRFAAGVRILVLSDSCHSGTVTRNLPPQFEHTTALRRSKMMPISVGLRTYREHRKFYDGLQQGVAKAADKTSTADPDSILGQLAVSPRLTTIAKAFKPSVILISGCQDNQTSMDGEQNGAFTEQLLKVWNHGNYSGNYAKFHAAIRAGLPASQTPNLFTLGAVARFLRQQPFSV
ncbi:MAG: caspase family protein [Nitrospira sp.]|nr:caspase family protein [Nitrospira sp.]